jgi:hypothetical protein
VSPRLLLTPETQNFDPAVPSPRSHSLLRRATTASVLALTVTLVSAGLTVASASAAPIQAAASTTASSALFGGTPRGASNVAGVASMDSTYGPAKVIRLFWSGAAGTSPTSNREVVGSLKTVDSRTAPWARTMWRWAYQHEIDSKIKKGQTTLAQWRSKMATLVKMKVPGLSVILTADAFVNKSKRPADYLVAGVTHWGVDFDGISQSGGYHNYAKELAAVQSFTAAHHLTWGVAEFGANRASNDPSGTARAAWLKTWGGRFAAAGAEYVCLWENNFQAGSNFTTKAENTAVRQLLSRSGSLSGASNLSVKQGNLYRGGQSALGGVSYKVAVTVSRNSSGQITNVRGTATMTKRTKVSRVQIDRVSLGTSTRAVLYSTRPVNSGTGLSASSGTTWRPVHAYTCTWYRVRATYSIRWSDGALSHASVLTAMPLVCGAS